ncbi:flagellar brake protein [Anaeromusa acidaminophila]|uniref:flagellar brake protein n=1 Tax=Anaeromusa acidaminophila TaxID=81464 RepID=UPI00036CC9B4|nr:flagellar brake domain-containing protein [Anaeromusa acidaminophila]
MSGNEQEQIPEKLLQPNQRLEIMLMDGSTEVYQSRIEEVHKTELIVAMPMSKGYPVLLYEGSKFIGNLLFPGGKYVFTSFFLGKALDPLPVWKISLPQNIHKVQQRSFVRVAARISVRLTYTEKKGEPPRDELIDHSLILDSKDISGGVSLIAKHALKYGQIVQLSMQVPGDEGDELIETLGTVVRCEKPADDSPFFWIGVRFESIQERDRQKVVRFVFKKQLEHRQKGLR